MLSNKGLHINCFAVTDKMDRKDNQDFFLSEGDNHLYIVADGMGGHKGGALASKFASFMAQSIMGAVDSLVSTNGTDEWSLMSEGEVLNYEDVLKHIYLEAHRKTMVKGIDHNTQGMGCTIVLLLFRGERLYILNAGDSRCYRYGEEDLCRLTRDHSLVDELLRDKQISKEQTKSHHGKNLVRRWIGGDKFSGMPDTYSMPYYANDRFIICTDGVTKELDDAKIEEFAKTDNIKDAANGMIAAVKATPYKFREVTELDDDGNKRKAMRKINKDNATVMIVEVVRKAKDAAADIEKTHRWKLEG